MLIRCNKNCRYPSCYKRPYYFGICFSYVTIEDLCVLKDEFTSILEKKKHLSDLDFKIAKFETIFKKAKLNKVNDFLFNIGKGCTSICEEVKTFF